MEREVRETIDLLNANTANSDVLYRILSHVGSLEQIPLLELEDYIFDLPEHRNSTQAPYTLLTWLTDKGALQIIDIDETGNPVDEEHYPDLAADQLEDLVMERIVTITEAGKCATDIFSPSRRIRNLFASSPEHEKAYIEALRFVTQKRSFAELDKHLRSKPELLTESAVEGEPIQPSSIIGKLSRSGVVVFDGAWVITKEGLEFLEELQHSVS